MNTRTALIGKILRWAALVTILASLFGMPNAVPAYAQTEGTDPNLPVQLSPLEQGGVDHQTLLEGMSAGTKNMSVLPDSRKRITPTNTIPWQYIAQVLFVYPNATTEICTGFFIGPFTIITAGHCVYNPGRGGAVTRADVTPGLDGTTSPYGMEQGILTYTTSGWYLSQDPLYDYGAVQLSPNATIGYTVGWMGYGVFSDSYLNKYLTGTTNLAGYPLDKDGYCPAPNAACLWSDSGPLTGVTPQILSYGMDTDFGDAGEDGAPIWVNDSNNFYATGINLFDSGGLVFPAGCATGSNCGLRITSEVATNFTTWSGKGPVTNCYALTNTVLPAASGSVTVAPAPNCAGGLYKSGTNITLTAVPKAGNAFLEWTGAISGAANPYLFSITAPTSVTANFVTMPALPVLIAPASNALVTIYNPVFDWSDSAPNLDHYQIQIANNLAFTSMLDDQIVVPSTYTPGPSLPSNTTLYWRVRAFDSHGFTRGWTVGRILRTALLPPNLVAPEEDAHPLTLRPVFSWDPVTGASSYTIQVAKNNNFTLIANTATIAALTTYSPLVNLPPNITLYWRVRANGLRGPSGWSEIRSLHSANPPGIPLLIAPAVNSLQTDYSPTLRWSKSILPTTPGSAPFDHYQVQIATDLAFAAIVQDADVATYATPEYTASPDLNPNVKYYWRVRAWNTIGHYSAWSTVRYFRSAILPTLLSAPADTVTVPTVRPTFDWDNVTGANGYSLQASKNNIFTLVVLSVNIVGGTNSQYTPLVNLPVNMVLYWRVRANGPNGPSLWSSPTWSLTTPNPPGVPLLTAPPTNSLLTEYSPTLKWSKPLLPITPGSAAFKQYEIQIATDAAFTTNLQTGIVGDYSTLQYIVSPALSPNLKYYWRVRAVDMFDHYSIWSTVRYFRTALSAPVLSTPTDGDTTITSLRPPFVWASVSGAVSYTIQVSRNSTFTLLVVNKNTVGAVSTYTPTVNLPANIPLYWRVRTNGVNGPSLWSSPVWSFMIVP